MKRFKDILSIIIWLGNVIPATVVGQNITTPDNYSSLSSKAVIPPKFETLERKTFYLNASSTTLFNQTKPKSKTSYSLKLNFDSTVTAINDYAYYMHKSKAQKTAAWILLSVGTTATVGGLAIQAADDFVYGVDNFGNALFGYKVDNTPNTGTIIAIAGIGMVGGSIPLFIAGSKNKQRAMLHVSTEKIGIGLPGFDHKKVVGPGIFVKIGK